MTWPVMNPVSSEARKRAALAISSTVPASPREAISPQKRAAKHLLGGVYGTSSTVGAFSIDIHNFPPFLL